MHLVPRLRMVELHILSPVGLHGNVVKNVLSTGITLPLPLISKEHKLRNSSLCSLFRPPATPPPSYCHSPLDPNMIHPQKTAHVIIILYYYFWI